MQNKHAASSGGVASNIDRDTHKAGTEPLTERARNLTEVAHVSLQGGPCRMQGPACSRAGSHVCCSCIGASPPIAAWPTGKDAHRGDGGDADARGRLPCQVSSPQQGLARLESAMRPAPLCCCAGRQQRSKAPWASLQASCEFVSRARAAPNVVQQEKVLTATVHKQT